MIPILECKNLSKDFNGKIAINSINLTLERGKIIGLLGPNGSGKTTLIKLINGLLTPSLGEILIDGKFPSIETKKIVSYLPDTTYLNDDYTVERAINLFKDFYGDFDEACARDMLNDLNIEVKSKMKSLSKGTREKVQLILVMSRRAELYVLDEPIGAVDPAARDYIISTILNNYSENASVLISTHLIQDVEKIFDEIIFIKDGEISLHSTVDEIREASGKSIDALFREEFKC